LREVGLDDVVSVYAPGQANLPIRQGGRALDRRVQVVSLLCAYANCLEEDLNAALAGRPANSLKALANDFSDYLAFVEEPGLNNGRAVLPAVPAQIVAYLEDCRERNQKPATVRRRVASLRALHELAGVADPTRTPPVRAFLREMMQPDSVQMPDTGFEAPVFTLPIMLEACDGTPPGLRDAALLALACDVRLKVSQALAVRVEQIGRAEGGGGVLRREGMPDSPLAEETMQRVGEWCQAAEITAGALFRRVAIVRTKAREGRAPTVLAKLAWNARGGEGNLGERRARPGRIDYVIGENALTAAAIREIVRRVAARAADLGLVALEGRERQAAIAAVTLQSLFRHEGAAVEAGALQKSEGRNLLSAVAASASIYSGLRTNQPE
jgi:integrase